MLWLAEDVLTRWYLERMGRKNVGRTLAPGYCYFEGDGRENYFRNAYQEPFEIWNWSLLGPYKEG